jgi:hypothetical protein
MTPTPANPENVPLDKIPSGWRLLYQNEYFCENILPCRVWSDPENKGNFSSDIDLRPSYAEYTYITPDLPDNGQPWRAHKPGDPAPVKDRVPVDVILKHGGVHQGLCEFNWGDMGTSSILFYRLHDPATIKVENWPASPPKPFTTPHISDRILDLLIVAGHVTAERVEQARKLAQL